jgi:predicted GH43/DUF377 family glycosyl hydrolase
MNEKYSYKDFTGKILTETDPKEWNDTEVIGSCFANQKPKTEVFPKGITGVKFIKCNLDNCLVPQECEIVGGCHRWIAVQNDLEDWLLDENLNPVEPLNKKAFEKLSLSTSPLSISASKVEEPVTWTKRKEYEDALQADIKALEDAAKAWR